MNFVKNQKNGEESNLVKISIDTCWRDIFKDTKSLTIADKVINKLFNSSDILEEYPELYPIDKFKTNNNGTYRAYEVYSYRISYRVFNTKIRILRVRHTSREPLILMRIKLNLLTIISRYSIF